MNQLYSSFYVFCFLFSSCNSNNNITNQIVELKSQLAKYQKTAESLNSELVVSKMAIEELKNTRQNRLISAQNLIDKDDMRNAKNELIDIVRSDDPNFCKLNRNFSFYDTV